MKILIYAEGNQVPQMWLSAMRARDLIPDADITIATIDTQSAEGRQIEQICGGEGLNLIQGFWGKLDALRDVLSAKESVLFLEAGVLLENRIPPTPGDGEVFFGALNAVGKMLYDCDELGRWKEPETENLDEVQEISGQRAVCCHISGSIEIPEYAKGSFGEGNLLGWVGKPKFAPFTWRYFGDANGRLNQQGMVLVHRLMTDFKKGDPKEAIPSQFWDRVCELSPLI